MIAQSCHFFLRASVVMFDYELKTSEVYYLGIDNNNNLIQRWNKHGDNAGFISTIGDQDVKDGFMHDDFPDILHSVHTDIQNMYDSDSTTIFAGQKNGRSSDDPMKQYRRIPFHFQV